METRLRLGTRTLRVSVAPDGDGFAVAVDEAGHAVRRIATGPRSALAGGTSEEVTLDIDGRPTRAVVAHVRERGTQRVLVAVGDVVTAGQPLVVLEAMKMESTLTAEIPGRVRTLAAVAGATVTAGDVLVEIAPAAE